MEVNGHPLVYINRRCDCWNGTHRPRIDMLTDNDILIKIYAEDIIIGSKSDEPYSSFKRLPLLFDPVEVCQIAERLICLKESRITKELSFMSNEEDGSFRYSITITLYMEWDCVDC